MSVVNVFASSKRVAMLTDESVYRPDATIVGFTQKAFPVEAWNGAISGRGDIWGINTARALAERYASLDDFIAQSGPEIERLHRESLAAAGEGVGQTLTEIHVIGWSDREGRAQAYYLRSPMPGGDSRGEPYVWRDLADEDDCFYLNMSSLEYWRLHRQGAEPEVDFDAETFDPMQHGLPLIEAQRRGQADAKYGAHIGGKHVIGGAVWLTVVDREGTRQGVIHEWNDEVGELIEPAPFDDDAHPKIAPSGMPAFWPYDRFMRALEGGAIDPETFKLDSAKLKVIEAEPAPVPIATAGMSRQQRRAAAAQARKHNRAA